MHSSVAKGDGFVGLLEGEVGFPEGTDQRSTGLGSERRAKQLPPARM